MKRFSILSPHRKISSFLYSKPESLSEQNAYPALLQIAYPYKGLAQFFTIGRMKIFSSCPFIDLLANFCTYLMIDF